jgi:two-component system, chemotaxis family, protein-glutamate methylesterase/glutaminase
MMQTPHHDAAMPRQQIDDAYRIIIVDDSVVIRRFIERIFVQKPGFKVVATANNGQQAVLALKREPADVIILDIEMPVMDGLTAIPELKAVDPAVQIIMASTLTQRNADISLRALALGATDYIPKPSSEQELNAPNNFGRDLLEKVKELGAIARRKNVRQPGGSPKPIAALPAKKPPVLRQNLSAARPEIIAIGASTGGPQALFDVIRKLGAKLPQPIVITQHMPASFTAILAEHIGRQCGVDCTEAIDGESLKAGHYYLAPGDYHMLIVGKPGHASIKLTKDPHENYCRPAVDPMLRSLAEVYGKRIAVIILTGMGQDGWKGSEAVVNAGGVIIAQDEATSVVWGMPGAVANAGLCSAVLPISDIGTITQQMAMRI